jgi:adenine-specific DNA-methyltransferase
MRKDQATALIEETFDRKFNKDNFSRFIFELFNKSSDNLRSIHIPPTFRNHISSANSLGNYNVGGEVIAIITAKLENNNSRDIARTMQRNFIAGQIEEQQLNGAIVAFYDSTDNWRLSFVEVDYSYDDSNKVKKTITNAKRSSFLVGPDEPNHTCKKQFLELLTKSELGISYEHIKSLFSIENVSKLFFKEYEALFKELLASFDTIKEKDSNIKKEFEDKGISSADFIKKLMGQIVFLYFIQKKGWLGVDKDSKFGSGNKTFLYDLFKECKLKNDDFFNDYLEYLFYDTLAKDRRFDNDYSEKFKCRIPFLNGGLFETLNGYNWEETDIKLGNDLFDKLFETFNTYNFTIKEDEPLEKEIAVDPEMLGKVFENLLPVNERKNKGAFYTPREIVHYMCQQSLINYLETNSNILKKDIENFVQKSEKYLALTLLYESNEKTKKPGVKSEWALPESIKQNYEELDKLLTNIKIIDPAVGSGAFPMGMMSEIVRLRQILSIYFSKSGQIRRDAYSLKKNTLENCIYGVDIMPSAIDICKLRFWLSLVVDAEGDKIEPLPNLESKLRVGNSLLEEFEGVKLFDEKLLGKIKKDNSEEIKKIENKISELNEEKKEIGIGKGLTNTSLKQIDKKIKKLNIKLQNVKFGSNKDMNRNLFDSIENRIKQSEKKIKEYISLQNKLYNEQDSKRKKEFLKKLDRIEWELIEETLKEKENSEAKEKLWQIKKSKSKPFFLWKLYFVEVFQGDNPGFDVVITNPPYVGEKGHKELFREIKNTGFGKQFYKRKMDLFYFFFHKALDLAKKKATISFITTNYFITADGAIYLRTDFKNRANVLKLINFNELKIFESARGQHNLITILKKDSESVEKVQTIFTNRTGNANSEILNDILKGTDRDTAYSFIMQNDLFDGEENYIRMSDISNKTTNPVEIILNKLKSNSIPLIQLKKINQGLLSGADKVTNKHLINFNLKNINKGDGIFVLSNEEIKSLNLKNDELKLIKPFYKNSNIYKYFSSPINNKNVMYLTRELNISNYPNIKKHTLKFEKIIRARSKGRGEMQAALKLGKWWVIFAARQGVDFEGPKIICPQRSLENTFAYNEESWYASADVYYITNLDNEDHSCDLKYILALINSKIYYLWLHSRGKRKGKLLELLYKPLSEIPIKKIPKPQQTPFIALVDQILSITKDGNYLDNKHKQEKVEKLKKEIDQLVYKLYGLSPEEIKIVEEFSKKN